MLCAGDVSLSVGTHPYGTCAQLHHGRCHCPLSPRARLQRAAPHGLGCLRPAGAIVERRKLSQWFFKITQFAEELLAGLDTLERWPEKVRLMQKNWIGKSEGLRFQFTLSTGGKLDVFTTRPDTLFGASFVAL